MEGLVGQLSVHEDAEGGEGDTAGQTVGLLLASLQQHTNHLVLNTKNLLTNSNLILFENTTELFVGGYCRRKI
jgi:hypothetical protein